MDVKIIPQKLKGTVEIPSSKSASHRMLICAGLSNGVSSIKGITMSKDIDATINALVAMGAEINADTEQITVKGITAPQKECTIDCCESGSTLRFIIPIAAALGISAAFLGKGKLPERPITPYLREFKSKGIKFDYNNTMPFSISGKLCAGEYILEGDISSQFITGLLFALPLCEEDSIIKLSSVLQSKPYADMTVDCLKKFGIMIKEIDNAYLIKGNQKYKAFSAKVEGDYSQAAFFYVANALGSNIKITNLFPDSVQGDKKILEIIENMRYTSNTDGCLKNFSVDVGDIPDLVPILAVLGCFGDGVSEITNASRLRIKESDRLTAIAAALNNIGGNVKVFEDKLIIKPVKELNGGIVDSFNDHRIVMAMAIASIKCTAPIVIRNADAVEKSYPSFFDDFNILGGNANVINLEQ